MNKDTTKKLLLENFKRYPKMTSEDVFKLIYQSAYGCEHMVSSLQMAEERIINEVRELPGASATPLIEPLGKNYSRVSLDYLSLGLSASTLAKLFVLSAKKEENGGDRLKEMITAACELVSQKELPLDKKEFDCALLSWEQNGFAPIHHSNEFRCEYHPAYRVISNDFVRFLPLFAEIDRRLENGSLTVAIEGGCGSGKTTLSSLISKIYDANIFHIDDFFLQPEQRIPERMKEVGGNFDRERFILEVMLPHSQGKSVEYRRFDCTSKTILEGKTIEPKLLTVVEGVYSMHPELQGFYDLGVFLDISPELQKERILKRNSKSMAKRFFDEWIPLENMYFEKMNIKDKCALQIFIDK